MNIGIKNILFFKTKEKNNLINIGIKSPKGISCMLCLCFRYIYVFSSSHVLKMYSEGEVPPYLSTFPT